MNRPILRLHPSSPARSIQAIAAILLLQVNLALAVEPSGPASASDQSASPAPIVAPLQAHRGNIPFDQLQHASRNPFDAYRGKSVPPPSLANSARLDSLIKDGKLYLSLQNAIDLALENNLDLVIARYNLPIAQMDVLRTQAGGSVRGVNTGVVSGTPGGAGVSFGGSSGAGAGGTSGGAGGAGAGASGLVQSTLGTGSVVNSYDPFVQAKTYVDHTTQLLPNQILYGVPVIHQNTFEGNFTYSQAFATGAAIQVGWDNNRQTTNSPNNTLNPQLNSFFEFYAEQQLMAGFGLGPNLRYLRIARTNQKVSDIAFRAQLIATVTQICDLYWDLVNAYDNEQVGERSVAFATETLNTARKQLALQAIPEMDVLKAEADVATRQQDLTVARTNLELQELYMKNAITRSLDDSVLQEMPVVPTDHIGTRVEPDTKTVQEMIADALKNRTELAGVEPGAGKQRAEPQDGAQRAAASAFGVRFLRRHRVRRHSQPTERRLSQRARGLWRRGRQCVQLLFSRISGGLSVERSVAQSHRQGRPVPHRTRVPAVAGLS